MARIVIAPHAGGLGDALLYSTLPELFARRGDAVFISTLHAPRNLEIADLVWGANPHVSGFVNEPGTISGADLMHSGAFSHAVMLEPSPIAAMEGLHGFRGTGNLLPRVYYEPKALPEFAGRVVADPRSTTQELSADAFDAFAAYLATRRRFALADVVVLQSKHSGAYGAESLMGNHRHDVANIFELADIVHSCGALLAVNSGTQALAAAIVGPLDPAFGTRKLYTLATTQDFNEHFFEWPNVQYSNTGRMTRDFHLGWYPPEFETEHLAA